MHQKANTTPFTSRHHTMLQRKCACGQHTITGGECEECRQKREGMLQRMAVTATPVKSVPPIVHEVLSSRGKPLDASTRTFMESRFGHDFSQVRVHTDTKAAESARAVNALAYTVGGDMVFGEGQYELGTSEGKRLLAHELTHVVQQDSQSMLNQSLTTGPFDSPMEQEADHIADAVGRDVASETWQSTLRTSGEQQLSAHKPTQAVQRILGNAEMLLQRQETPASGTGGTTELPPVTIPGTGLTLIPGPLHPSFLGTQIPLPANLQITNASGVGTTPTFIVDLSPKRLLALILGSVDLHTWSRPGTPPGSEVNPENQARISLVNPTILLDPVSRRLHGRAILSLGSDYPPEFKEPTNIVVYLTSGELGQFTGQLGYGPLHADINLKLHYDVDRLEKSLQTSLSQFGSELTHPGFSLRGRLGLGKLPLSSFKVNAPTTEPLAHPLLGAPAAFPLTYSGSGVIIAPPGSISQTAVPAFGVTGSSFGEKSGISGTAAVLPTLSPSAITERQPLVKQFPVYAYVEGTYVRRVSKELDLGLRITVQGSTPALFGGTGNKAPLNQAEQTRRILQDYRGATQPPGTSQIQTPPYGANLSIFGRFNAL